MVSCDVQSTRHSLDSWDGWYVDLRLVCDELSPIKSTLCAELVMTM